MIENAVKSKKLKLNANESVAEINCIALPCIAEYKGDRVTFLEYNWTQIKDNKVYKRGIEVSGHGKYGVPTLREQDVLLALQRIFIQNNTHNGVCELKRENITEEDLHIDFTLHQLARELGYNSPNNKIRELLKTSIKILVATTIFNAYDGGIFDNVKKEYITNPDLAFHFIEAINGIDTVDVGNEHIDELIENMDRTSNGVSKEIDLTKIKISRFFYDMIAHNYHTFYSTDIFYRTKNLTARKIYMLAKQWKGDKDYSFCKMETLIEKIPIKQEEMKYKKLYIKRALDELNDKKIVKAIYPTRETGNNTDMVYFIFNENQPIEDILDKEYINKYKDKKEVLEGFKKYGFKKDEIKQYYDDSRFPYLQALLRYCDVKVHAGIAKNPKEYFLRGLTGDGYDIAEKYYTKY